jgi:pilus assembly protein CpaF
MGIVMDGVRRVLDRLLESSTGARSADRTIQRLSAIEAPLRADAVAAEVTDWVEGFGPVEPLLVDPAVTDVLINAPNDIWIEREGRLQRAEVRFPDSGAVVAAVERALLPLGLRLDRTSPTVDARLSDGSRLHAVIPPAAIDGPVVAIRRFTPAVTDLDDLVAAGAVDESGARLLGQLVANRHSLLVSGATGAGKTTLLNVLSTLIPAGERTVTIEEAAELEVRGHVVRLEARPPNAEGAGEISVRSLVRAALRMRPDRIVVGEVRGPEALDLIQAMSTGHRGSLGTVHASGPEEALWRLETLAAMAPDAVPPTILGRMLRRSVDAVIHVARHGDRRRVDAIAAVDEGGTELLWER